MSDKPVVQIKASEASVAAYRELLIEDWSSDHPRRCSRLIRELMVRGGLPIIFPWELDPLKTPAKKNPRPPRIIPPNTAEYVREFIEMFDADLPESPEQMPERQDPEKVRLAHETQVASTLLSVQSIAKLAGNVGFFVDCQSLLFGGAVHVLWEELRAQRMSVEQRLLANSLWMHATIVWDSDPSHKYFLRSQVHDMVGNRAASASELRRSFETCPPSAHEWITKAQAYWSALVDLGEVDAARDFALLLYRSAPSEHLDEIVQIVDDTYRFKVRMSDRITKRRVE